MEILLTEQFATSVRRSPGPCRAGIEQLVGTAGPVAAPAAEYLGHQHLVGYSRGAGRISFWCLFKRHAVAGETATAPLAVLSRNELLELGVPRELVRRVQRARSIPQLDALPLEPDAAGRLRFKLLQQLQGVRAIGADLKRRSPDAQTFGRFLHGDITDLMLNLEPAQQRQLLAQARQQQAEQRKASSLWSCPLEFWKAEIHLIKGRVSRGLSQYLDMPRTGAGRPLDKPGRALVWGVYQQYHRLCRLSGKLDWDDLVSAAHRRIVEQGREHSLYAHVLVDEAQDLSPLCLRLAQLLVCERGREYAAVSRDIAARIEQGVPPQNMAVLCFPNRVRDEMFETLRRAGINCQRHSGSGRIRLGDPSVKLLPVKSAKGLEFPVIYFPVSQRWFSVPRSIRQQEDRAAYRAELRRTFYMAMTRAMSRLVLVFEKDHPADFIRPAITRS